MIDNRGYRLNVGIILMNKEGKLFWGQRYPNQNSWQFPQGGMQPYETIQETMYRELYEELGLTSDDVEMVAYTRRWLYYQIPHNLQRNEVSTSDTKHCLGQKQRWFLLKFIGNEKNIVFDKSNFPEFVNWCWVDYLYPLQNIVYFKRQVYETVLREFTAKICETIKEFSQK